MWYTYIIFSRKINKYYTGYTENLQQLINRHNSSWGKYTSKGIPWEIFYFEEYQNKSAAIKREKEIKSKKSRKYIELLIKGQESRPE